MAKFLLIRHGHNDMVAKKLAGRLPGVHLNEVGHTQAQRLATLLANVPIRAIYSSPLERAQETALPIAEVHDLGVTIMPELIEMDYGKWQGKRLKALQRRKLWKTIQAHPSQVRFPQGESFVEAQERIVAGITALNQQYDEMDWVACVSHCDVIKLLIAHFLGLPLDNFQRLQIDPASVSVLFLHEGKAFFGPINHTLDFPES
jgi:probable phosphomutase (TIGR03848 family)